MQDIANIRQSFPILHREVYGRPLVYLDNGATTQKPQVVIDTINEYYKSYNANVHRGVHYLSQIATDRMEQARDIIARYINAPRREEVIFTKGTTDGINLLAFSLGEDFIQEGDVILITEMEHHSNIVPWQMMCQRKKAKLRYIPIDEEGNLILDNLETLLEGVKILSFTWVSNTLGTINPVGKLLSSARKRDIITVVDAAQALPHIPIDVQSLDCDFLVASSHKAYGPTGIGFLYGRYHLLAEMTPYQGGGAMIQSVSMKLSSYTEPPFRFEAGTPDISGAIGMAAGIEYMESVGIAAIAAHEHQLLIALEDALSHIPAVNIIGNAKEKAAVVSMTFDNAHTYDVGELLDKQGVAVRTGHHCCQPIMNRYNIPGTLRVSLAMYNDGQELERFIIALERSLSML